MSTNRRNNDRNNRRRQPYSRGNDDRRRSGGDRNFRDRKVQNVVSPWETPAGLGYQAHQMMGGPMIMYQPVFVPNPAQHHLQQPMIHHGMRTDFGMNLDQRSRNIKNRLSKPNQRNNNNNRRQPYQQNNRQRGKNQGNQNKGRSGNVRVDLSKLKSSTREKLETHEMKPENIKCFVCLIPHFDSLQSYIDHLKCPDHREIRKQYDIYSVKSHDARNLSGAIQKAKHRLSTKGSLPSDMKPRSMEFTQQDLRCCGSNFKNRVLLNAHRLHTEHMKVADIESAPNDNTVIDLDPKKNEECKKVLLEAIEKSKDLPKDFMADENIEPEKPSGLHQVGLKVALSCDLCTKKPDMIIGGTRQHFFKSMPRRHLGLLTHYDNIICDLFNVEEKAKTLGDDIWPKDHLKEERDDNIPKKDRDDNRRRRRNRNDSDKDKNDKAKRRPSKYDYNSPKSDEDDEDMPRGKKEKNSEEKDLGTMLNEVGDTLEMLDKEEDELRQEKIDEKVKEKEEPKAKEEQKEKAKEIAVIDIDDEHSEANAEEDEDEEEQQHDAEEEELNYDEDDHEGAEEEEQEEEDDEDEDDMEDVEGELREIEEQFGGDDDDEDDDDDDDDDDE